MRANYFYGFLIVLVLPVIGLWLGMKNRVFKYRRYVLTFFITIFGSVYYSTEESDIFRHQQSVFDHYTDLSFSIFLDELLAILYFRPYSGTNDDVYIHTLSYLIGNILGAPGLFITIVAFIYGYFFSGVILKLFQLPSNLKPNLLFVISCVSLLLFKHIDGFGTVRTWTGLWILLYGFISYYEVKKIKYLFLLFVPPFIHIGYFVMAIPVWIILFFGNRPFLYSILFFISFLGPIVNQSVIIENFNKTQIGAEKVSGYYIDEDSARHRNVSDEQAWYRRLQQEGLQQYSVLLIAFWIILSGNFAKSMNGIDQSLFSAGLLMKVLSNSTTFLFALSNRTGLIANVLILASLVLFLKERLQNGKKNNFIDKAVIYLSGITLIPFLVYNISSLSYKFSIFLFFAPFVEWLIDDINIPIREVVGNLF